MSNKRTIPELRIRLLRLPTSTAFQRSVSWSMKCIEIGQYDARLSGVRNSRLRSLRKFACMHERTLRCTSKTSLSDLVSITVVYPQL
jgi:hypothetical protein